MKHLLIAALAFGASALVHAQEYPTKPIRIIVPFGAGSATDALARTIGPKMTEMWGQQVIVENRPGAGSVVGTSVAAKAPADGYTLLVVSASHAINATLYAKLPVDPVKDFAGITPLALIPNILIVHPSLPAKNVKELVAMAKAKPDTFNYTSAGIGSNSQPGTPASTIVGSCGNADERLLLLTASARTFPALMCGEARIAGANVISRRPATISVIASAQPLNGTCTIFTPAVLRKSSPLMCEFEPTPADV